MSSDLAIRLTDLWKIYSIGGAVKHRHSQASASTLAQAVIDRVRRVGCSDGKKDFTALRDVNLEVDFGEVLGIVGPNGAGKSTLLKIVSQITEPSSGRLELYGRVGSLLEVGTGFHPELTGRENIFLNGAILGMSRGEIKRQFDEIVEFAEVGEFLETPVKRYSSGMYVRLAFAIASHLQPDILIIDEVLAVGDAAFQQKCLQRMEKVSKQGRTILFVSHNLAAVKQLCSRAIYIDSGRLRHEGSVDACIEQYLGSHANASASYTAPVAIENDSKNELDGSEAEVESVHVRNHDGTLWSTFHFGQLIVFDCCVRWRNVLENAEYVLRIQSQLKDIIFTTTRAAQPPRPGVNQSSTDRFQLVLDPNLLMPGNFQLRLDIHVPFVKSIQCLDPAVKFQVEETGSPLYRYRQHDLGSVQLPHRWTNSR